MSLPTQLAPEVVHSVAVTQSCVWPEPQDAAHAVPVKCIVPLLLEVVSVPQQTMPEPQSAACPH